jgi:hypothetical protein
MARLSIDVPDDLRAKVEVRASEAGYANVEAYVEALLRADLEPVDVEDDDIEALLLERIDSTEPGVEVTPQFVEQFKQQQAERRKRSGGGRA